MNDVNRSNTRAKRFRIWCKQGVWLGCKCCDQTQPKFAPNKDSKLVTHL